MAQIASPARTPFGMLDGSRLQQLTNTKNKQNALLPSSSVLSKRKHTADPFASDVDSENFDPSLLSSKKSKRSSEKSSKFASTSLSAPRPSHFILKTDNTASVLSQAPSISTRHSATPKRTNVPSILDTTPRTAPAGRSPRRKRAGLAGKRRISAPFTRINPPTFGLNSNQGSALPFSIDAALSGSVPSYQASAPKLTAWEASVDSLGSKPSKSSWFFEIHEDTPEEELGNLMEFSTQTLDISDDETKADKRQREMEERGKENIPPGFAEIEADVIVPVPVSRKDVMSDGPRTPLGELEAREFYAEGCDETSVVIVPADEGHSKPTACAPDVVTTQSDTQPELEPDSRGESPTESKGSNQDTWQELLARVDEQQAALAVEAQPGVHVTVPEEVPLPPSDDDVWAIEATSREEAPLFEIWESESAKEEAEELDAVAAF